VRWVTFPKGDRAHAVMETQPGRTICGLLMSGDPVEFPSRRRGVAAEVAAPSHDERCENCDKEWRRRGRERRPKKRAAPRGETYRPRFRFED